MGELVLLADPHLALTPLSVCPGASFSRSKSLFPDSHASSERLHSVDNRYEISRRQRAWLAAQPLSDDERAAIDRHVRELDRLAEDLAHREIA
jgi:hypothetical protein